MWKEETEVEALLGLLHDYNYVITLSVNWDVNSSIFLSIHLTIDCGWEAGSLSSLSVTAGRQVDCSHSRSCLEVTVAKKGLQIPAGSIYTVRASKLSHLLLMVFHVSTTDELFQVPAEYRPIWNKTTVDVTRWKPLVWSWQCVCKKEKRKKKTGIF